jgi:hypothetical protein
MTAAYEKAAALAPMDPYPALNALAGVLLLGGPSAALARRLGRSTLATPAGFDEALERNRRRAELMSTSAANFWEAVHAADADLLETLRRNRVHREIDRLEGAYRALFKRLGSKRELDSVANQCRFYAKMITGSARKTAAPALEKLAKRLEA